ncbi:DUF445 domain-containing protein [Ruegeria hyattellae]|uniref:DUF445 domain-containing protein n=1 Tax=Ruegeria hyattellae TaxID=3233337 RepID=UPI00355C4000
MIEAGITIDVEKAAAIRKVRRTATGILGFLTLVFAASFAIPEPPTWLLLVRAMAEAGMVGGLADWFAVEALFRHPLGLPIPHTALLPNNQRRAAGNIARFIDEYFLAPEQLLREMQQANPALKAANWLEKPDNAAALSRTLSQLLHAILHSQLRGGIGPAPTKYLRELMAKIVDSPALSRQITELLKGSVHSQLLNDILLQVRDVLDENRDTVMEVVQDRSRWWITTSVDKRITEVLVDGVLSIIDELSTPRSALRQDFEKSITILIDRFQETGKIAENIDQGFKTFTDSPKFTKSLEQVITAVLHEMDKGLVEQPDRIADLMARSLQDFARTVQQSDDMQDQLNARFAKGFEAILKEMRPAIVEYIAESIASWDSDQLVARMESEVGRDLQFIRINGAVLGAFVGGALFLLTHFAFGA